MKLQGKYNEAIIYGDHIDDITVDQVNNLLDQPFMESSTIRIMPDAHAGAGSVIGFTADMKEQIVPNLVGVDIGCGMLTVELGELEMDFQKLDKVIREHIPSGFNVRNKKLVSFPEFKELGIYHQLDNVSRLEKSLATLGGGNHFIEVDEDEDGKRYLIIHSGSRNFGHQVASIYQKKAIEEGKRDSARRDIPRDLAYLEGYGAESYLHDMSIAQDYAKLNRKLMAQVIMEKTFGLDLEDREYFETVHNYIEEGTRMVRKGAVSAQEGEKLLIPLSMKDGALIARGKGNKDWNYSAPHGAGRVLSRKMARDILSLKEFEKSMEGIFTTSVNKGSLDEAPAAYKPKEAIMDVIEETAEIEKHIKPIYNFKA